jgi:hypothetical protein
LTFDIQFKNVIFFSKDIVTAKCIFNAPIVQHSLVGFDGLVGSILKKTGWIDCVGLSSSNALFT